MGTKDSTYKVERQIIKRFFANEACKYVSSYDSQNRFSLKDLSEACLCDISTGIQALLPGSREVRGNQIVLWAE